MMQGTEYICDETTGFHVIRNGKDVDPLTFGDLLACALNDPTLKTQDELADALGVRPQVLSKWKRGKALPSDENMLKLAEFLKVNPEHALVLLNYWRCEDRGEKSAAAAYKHFADQYVEKTKKWLATGAILLALTMGLIWSGTYRAQAAPSAQTLYIMENIWRWLLILFSPFKHKLRWGLWETPPGNPAAAVC